MADVRLLTEARRLGSPPARSIDVRDWPAQAGQLYAAIVLGEETYTRRWLARLAAGVPLVDLCAHVIAPALRRIGADWASGLVSIAQEHRASTICERLIARHTAQPPERPRGCAHFLRHLVDADVACNQLNWQWVGGTGTDANRHRVFNPAVQARRFDPTGVYIRRYVPELGGLPAAGVHAPDPATRRACGYPEPILDHREAIAAYRAR